MRRPKRFLAGICAVLMMCFAFGPMEVKAAEANVTLGTTDNGTAGSRVTARIVIDDNPGITTLAMRLSYDNSYLVYDGAEWAKAISNSNSNRQMISEVSESGGPVLNISAIMNSAYSDNGRIVTLNFTVKQNYTTMPVKLSNREINDSSYDPVDVRLLVDAKAGLTDPQESEPETEDGSEIVGSQSAGSQKPSGSNNSGPAASGTNSQGKAAIDRTPKTGAVDIRPILGAVIAAFVLIAGVCVKILGKKRAR